MYIKRAYTTTIVYTFLNFVLMFNKLNETPLWEERKKKKKKKKLKLFLTVDNSDSEVRSSGKVHSAFLLNYR
jgi:hypothetical protein